MTNASRIGAAALTIALLAPPAFAKERIAVLEFRGPHACEGAGPRSKAARELCSVMPTFTDESRAGVRDATRSGGYDVLSRENIKVLVGENGGVCSEGECEVETGRLLQAAYVVSAEALLVDGTYLVTLKLHETRNGSLLEVERIEGRTRLDVIRALRATTKRMVASGIAAMAPAPAPPPPPVARVQADAWMSAPIARSDANERLRTRCLGGDAAACADLGFAFEKGNGVGRDEERAVQLYRRGCDGGNAVGCSNLGWMHENGRGTAQDAARAVELYRKGCDMGDARGCTSLGFLHANGRGVPRDDARAVELYRRGCDGGNSHGCTNLGWMHEDGRGTAQDAARAVELYRKGCDMGNAVGCSNLGFMFDAGKGTARDDARAAELYRKGCDMGDARGCSNLGALYANGRGVPRDEARASELYRKGCDGGNQWGCDKLKALRP